VEEILEFSKEELLLINEALIKANNLSETGYLETEKRMLDSTKLEKENAISLREEMYRQLLRKIEAAVNNMKDKLH
jgi:hypothetical protein